MLTPFPGTLDFAAWEKSLGDNPERIGGIPITRHWLIPQAHRPKVYMEHPVMSADEIRERTQDVWDSFYSFRSIWNRATASCKSFKARLAVRPDLEALPADVRQHRHRHRQRARQPLRAVGAMDGAPLPSSLRRATSARLATPLMPSGLGLLSFGRSRLADCHDVPPYVAVAAKGMSVVATPSGGLALLVIASPL